MRLCRTSKDSEDFGDPLRCVTVPEHAARRDTDGLPRPDRAHDPLGISSDETVPAGLDRFGPLGGLAQGHARCPEEEGRRGRRAAGSRTAQMVKDHEPNGVRLTLRSPRLGSVLSSREQVRRPFAGKAVEVSRGRSVQVACKESLDTAPLSHLHSTPRSGPPLRGVPSIAFALNELAEPRRSRPAGFYPRPGGHGKLSRRQRCPGERVELLGVRAGRDVVTTGLAGARNTRRVARPAGNAPRADGGRADDRGVMADDTAEGVHPELLIGPVVVLAD